MRTNWHLKWMYIVATLVPTWTNWTVIASCSFLHNHFAFSERGTNCQFQSYREIERINCIHQYTRILNTSLLIHIQFWKPNSVVIINISRNSLSVLSRSQITTINRVRRAKKVFKKYLKLIKKSIRYNCFQTQKPSVTK